MKLTNLLSFYITFSILASFHLDASGPSTVEQELAKQKKYASDLMVSINSCLLYTSPSPRDDT